LPTIASAPIPFSGRDVKAVILAGGLGTRLTEETSVRPKPMVEIGGKPILWHIMKMYSKHGINEFIICCGYKGYVIKEYFSNYLLHNADVTFDLKNRDTEIHLADIEPWHVTLVDTGDHTQTGGRMARVRPYLDEGDDFLMTYGDAVSDIDLGELIRFHKAQGTSATITAVQPLARFGALEVDDQRVISFQEKPVHAESLINGGFFVLSVAVLDYIVDDQTFWEHEPLERLAAEGNLSAYRHEGFWHAMDTLRDRNTLEELWTSGRPPWKTW
jgi:glucose-1-phosphate cytidylyltransferase